jgi:hypothetical protein
MGSFGNGGQRLWLMSHADLATPQGARARATASDCARAWFMPCAIASTSSCTCRRRQAALCSGASEWDNMEEAQLAKPKRVKNTVIDLIGVRPGSRFA